MTELDPRLIQAYDNKVRQEISFFKTSDDPLACAFVCDVSGSMASRIKTLHGAIRTFTQYAHERDEYSLIAFNRTVDLLGTNLSTEEVINRTLLFRPQKMTALYDGVLQGVEALKQSRYERRALILISDGQDNASRRNLRDLKKELSESQIRLFVINVVNPQELLDLPFATQHARSSDEEYARIVMAESSSLNARGKQVLEEIASLKGGRVFDATSDKEMEVASVNIALELRRSFSLGYVPTDSKESSGKKEWHSVKLKFAGNIQIVFSHRPGYWK